MKLLHGERPGEKQIAIIIGNGFREERILNSIIKLYKLNNTKTLIVPRLPYGRRPGLGPSIESIKLLVEMGVKTNTFVIIIDKEHVRSIDDVSNAFKNLGFLCRPTELMKNLLEIQCKIGIRNITTYVAILGYKKSIEEHLAELIKLQYHEEVKPNKEEIRRWLSQKKLKDFELIEQSHKRYVEKAFTQLVSLLNRLSKDPL